MKLNLFVITLGLFTSIFVKADQPISDQSLTDLLFAAVEAEVATGKQVESSDWMDQARNKVDQWSVDIKNSWGEGKEISKAKLEQSVNDLMLNMQEFEKAGFSITRLYISVGLVPSVTFQVEQIKQLTLEDKQALLDYYQDSFAFTYALKSLFKASELKVNDFELEAVRINISLAPSAIAIMEPID